MTIDTAPYKRLIASALLDAEPAFLVTLQTQHHAVVVPPFLRKQPYVSLAFGYRLAVKIPDLLCDESGISGTLAFGRPTFACFVPWDAVVGFATVEDGTPIIAFGPGMSAPAVTTGTPLRQRKPLQRGLRLIRGGASAVPVVDIGRRKPPAEGPQTA